MKKVNEQDKLLNILSRLKLKQYGVGRFKKFMISDDDPLWKRPKKDSEVNSFYVNVYELWRENLICRTFYITQMWFNKNKETRIFEVKRRLSGCDAQLTRRLYSSMGGGVKCWIYDNSMCYYYKDNNKWEKHLLKSFNLEFTRTIYGGYCRTDNRIYYLNSENEILEMLKKTKYRYSGFEYNQFSYSDLFKYLAIYERHPAAEMISKIGLGYLLDQDLRVIRWSKKQLNILGIKKDEVEILKKLRIPLKDFHKNASYIHKLKIKNDLEYNALIRLLEVSKIKYSDLNVSRYSLDYFIKNKNISIYEMKDYYRFCEELGLLMNHDNKFPENIKEAHDELMIKIETKKSVEKEQMIRKRVNNELFKFRYADEKFIITPANSIVDLIDESVKLKHCVRTYYDKYANGETNIFLIRERENANQPFYTLELVAGEIVQVRGYKNHDPSIDVKEFVNRWKREFKFKCVPWEENYE